MTQVHEPQAQPSWPLPLWAAPATRAIAAELRAQRGVAIPLVAMNLTWFAKSAVTTAFLGRLGELELAAGTLGFTFANVTGFSILTGLCSAMEPICGQAHGAKNHKLLHKTLLMATILLLAASLPISFLWFHVDTVLAHFGQQQDIAATAKNFLVWLLPDLVVTSFLCPLKAYLSSQGVTLPTLFSSAIALAFHIPLNVFLSRKRGVEGVSMAIWLSDLAVAVMLGAYVLVSEQRKMDRKVRCDGGSGGWLEQTPADWLRLLRLAVPCCLNTCLEWWCYEILVLLTGRLPDPRRMVAVIAVVLNFDYLLFGAMLSLAVSASVRVSNELGAGNASAARRAACVSIGGGALLGLIGASMMFGARRGWGHLYSHDEGVVEGVSKTMKVMALLEVVNFPLNVCGGIVRGTARPFLGMYAILSGFYFVALPVAVVLGFKARLGLEGLLMGFLVGAAASLALLVVVVARMDWTAEAAKARELAGAESPEQSSDGVETGEEC